MYSQPILAKIGAAKCAAEVPSYGTDATPVDAGNSFLLWDVSITPNATAGVPEYHQPWASSRHSVMGQRYCDVAFKVPLVGCGDSGGSQIEPPVTPVLEACRIKYTPGAPATSGTFTPDTIGQASCTIYLYLYGTASLAQLYKLVGFMGSAKLIGDPSTPYAYWEISGRALYYPPEDAAVPTPVYYEKVPPAWVGVVCTIDSEAFAIRKIELDCGSDLADGPSIGPASTYGYQYHIAIRKQARLIVETDALLEDGTNGYAFFAARDAGTSLAVAIGPVGSGDGEVWSLAATGTIIDIKVGEAQKLQTYTLTFALHMTSGDDEWTLTLT